MHNDIIQRIIDTANGEEPTVLSPSQCKQIVSRFDEVATTLLTALDRQNSARPLSDPLGYAMTRMANEDNLRFIGHHFDSRIVQPA